MADTQYIVAHTAVMLPPEEDTRAVGRTVTRGRFIKRDDLPSAKDWDRLVRIGAVKKATDDEVVLAEAHQEQDEALEFGQPGDTELADQRAKAERTLAEPPGRLEKGASVPSEAALAPAPPTAPATTPPPPEPDKSKK